MPDYPSIESLDLALSDEVFHVFTSDSAPFRSARKFYGQRREIWLIDVQFARTLGVSVKTGESSPKRISFRTVDLIDPFANALACDQSLMKLVKAEGLERSGFDNRLLARVFVIHLFSGEPYWTNNQ